MSFAFINIYNTLDEALSVRYSPLTNIYKSNGIQLLPLQSNKYVQTSYVSGDGIQLEDWEVFAVSACGTERTNLTANFFVERVFEDDNGIPQIDWSLKNLPELGYGLIYLEINQLMQPGGYADTWYTSLFQITAYEAESTARIDYRDSISDTMQSVQFQMYFWQPKKRSEFSSYTTVTEGIVRTVTSTASKYQLWNTQIIDRDYIIKLTDLFDLVYMYVDYVRCFPFESADIPDLEQAENYTEYSFTLSFDRKDIYDPNFVPVIPPPAPLIVLEQVLDLGMRRGAFIFDYYNFNPSSMIGQYSTTPFTTIGMNGDFVTINNPSDIDSPKEADFIDFGTYFTRIYNPDLNIVSNVVQVTLARPLIISSATVNRSGNAPAKYVITVNYSTTYFSDSTVELVLTGPNGLLTFIRPNTGQLIVETEVNIGNPGQTVQLVIRNIATTFSSEQKIVTIIQI